MAGVEPPAEGLAMEGVPGELASWLRDLVLRPQLQDQEECSLEV